MPTTVAVHLGPHRTGTTALQQFLRRHREDLAVGGRTYPEGLVEPDQHVELTFPTIRPERLAEAVPFFNHLLRKNRPDLPACTDAAWPNLLADLVASAKGGLVLSAEALSWIRHDDEVERFLALFGSITPSVVFVRRRPDAFLASYFQVSRFMTLTAPDGPDSLWYAEDDSWLVDYQARIDLWRRHLGSPRVEVVDYDAAIDADGTSVPAVAAALGIDTSSWNDPGDQFVNRGRDLPGTGPR
jgi:hypothetical protein